MASKFAALALTVGLLAAGCGDDSETTRGAAATPTPAVTSVPSEPVATPDPTPELEDSATPGPTPELEDSAANGAGAPDVEPAPTPGAPDQLPGPTHSADSFQRRVASAEPIALSPELLDLFDGLLLSVNVDVVFDDGGIGAASPVVGVAGGEAWMVKGRWCSWEYTGAMDGLAGSAVFERNSLKICTPGERVQTADRVGPPLASARVGDRRLLLVADADALQVLDLDSLEYEPFLEIDRSVESALSASFGANQWVVVMSEPDQDDDGQARRRIVFVDPNGATIDRANNPFPVLSDGPGPRAAALSADGATLVFSLEDADRSSFVVWWDLNAGIEMSRHRITDPFVPGDDPYGFGREYVSAIDVSDSRVLVNVSAIGGEPHASRPLLVDPDGTVTDLTDQDELSVAAAAFLQD